MSGYQSPSRTGEAFKHEVVSYLKKDILPSPAVGLAYFHFSPAGKAFAEAVTSGGLSKFLNAVGQGQRMKNLIRRNFFCSSEGSWGLHSLHTESPGTGWISSTEWDRKLSTIHQLFPSSRDAAWQQNLPQPDLFPARGFISPSPALRKACRVSVFEAWLVK